MLDIELNSAYIRPTDFPPIL